MEIIKVDEGIIDVRAHVPFDLGKGSILAKRTLL